MDNVQAYADSVLENFFSEYDPTGITTTLEPVSGYFTSKVYRFRVYDHGTLLKAYFIKESGNRSRQNLNRFIAREYENTRLIHERFESTDSLATANALGYSPEHDAFLIEEARGDRLDRLLLRRELVARNPDYVHRLLDLAVEWLRRFQKIEYPEAGKERDFPSIELGKLEFLKSRLLMNAPRRHKPRFEETFSAMERFLATADIDSRSIVIKHNDFAPWNIICDGNRITILDFADCSIDHPDYDLQYFANALDKIARKRPHLRPRLREYQARLLANCVASEGMQGYYRTYFILQDIEFVLREIRARGLSGLKYRLFYRLLLTRLDKLDFVASSRAD